MSKRCDDLNTSMTPWLTSIRPYDFRNKTAAVQQHVRYMLDRTARMFRWTGPEKDTIPEYILEQMAQANGNCFVTMTSKGLRAFTGGLGSTPDEYYRATEYIVSNSAMPGASKSYKIGKDGVLLRNDHMMLGLVPICNRYASQLVENDLSILMAQIISRAQMMITATIDADKLAADDFIRNLDCGKLSSVLGKSFVEGITVQPGAAGAPAMIGELIELEQYIKASWYNELGLDSNYNMKRESLTQTESQMNSDALLPLVDDMLKCREEFCDELNALYGVNWSVQLDSSWEDNQEQINEIPLEEAENGAQAEEKEVSEDEQTN